MDKVLTILSHVWSLINGRIDKFISLNRCTEKIKKVKMLCDRAKLSRMHQMKILSLGQICMRLPHIENIWLVYSRSVCSLRPLAVQ